MDKRDTGFIAALVLAALYTELTFQFLLGGILMVLIALCWLGVRMSDKPGPSIPLPLVLLYALVFVYSLVTMQILMGGILVALITLCWLGYKSFGEPGSVFSLPVVLLCGLAILYSIITMQLFFGLLVIILIIVSASCILPAARRYIRL